MLPWNRRWWTRLFDSGVKWVRIGQYENSSDLTGWDWIEQTRGVFKTTTDLDEAIRSLTENGISIQVQLCYSNVLYLSEGRGLTSASPASGRVGPRSGQSLFKGPSTPDEIEGFLRYVRYMVGRYRGRVRGWEFWNEPNIHFWEPVAKNRQEQAEKARQYGRILSRFADAVHETDPNAKVIAGGTSSVDPLFTLTSLADCAAKIDVVAYHSYPGFGSNHPPEEADTLLEAPILREQVLRLPGARRTIEFWDNEWNTIPEWKDSNESVQARYVPRFLLHGRAHGVKPFVWEFVAGTDGTEGDQFGLLHGDTSDQRAFQPRQALRGFEVTSALFGQTEVDRAAEVSLSNIPPEYQHGEVKKYCFRDTVSHKGIYALWLAVYSDPSDKMTPRPAVLKIADRDIANPVLIDVRTGTVSTLPWQDKAKRTVQVPLRDSVMAVADASYLSWKSAPEAPWGLRASQNAAEVILSWTTSCDRCVYEVQESANYGAWHSAGQAPAGAREFRLRSAARGHKSYRIRGVSAGIPSAWSNPVWKD